MNNPPVPYDKSLILKLNNYGYSQEVKEEIREFKRSNAVPAHIKGKKRYVDKWTPFYIDNQSDHLIYRPNNLKVIIDFGKWKISILKVTLISNIFTK